MDPATYLFRGNLDWWQAAQWNEAVDLWGTAVDDRLAERRMEPFEPPNQPMKPVPVHDLNSALGFDEFGAPLDPEFAQQEMLRARFGKE